MHRLCWMVAAGYVFPCIDKSPAFRARYHVLYVDESRYI